MWLQRKKTAENNTHVLSVPELSLSIFTFLYFLGYLALYSGLQPTLVRTIPATGTLFLLYETTKKVLHKLCD
jgi:solute carrier family 25 ornithine transporter 2/15